MHFKQVSITAHLLFSETTIPAINGQQQGGRSKPAMKALYAKLLRIEGKTDEEIACALGIEASEVHELLNVAQKSCAGSPSLSPMTDQDPPAKAA